MTNAGEVMRLGHEAVIAMRAGHLAVQRFRNAWNSAEPMSEEDRQSIVIQDGYVQEEVGVLSDYEPTLIDTLLSPSAAAVTVALPSITRA